MFVRSLLVLSLLTTASQAQLDVVGFDGVSAPGAFHQIPPGFANGPHLEYPGVTLDGGVILLDVLFDSAATSGDNILATCDTCGLGDNPPTGLPGDITGVFDAPVSHIELDVINGVGGSGALFTLTARNAMGAVIGEASVTTGPAGSPSSSSHLSFDGDGIASFVLGTGLGTGYTFAMDTLVFGNEPGDWLDLGGGVGGSQGVPTLQGEGPLVGGTVAVVTLSGAPALATATLVMGLSPLNASFKGGVLVPTPDLLVPGLPVSGDGQIVTPFVWPNGVPPGATLLVQYWIPDGTAAAGWAASNGLAAVAP